MTLYYILIFVILTIYISIYSFNCYCPTFQVYHSLHHLGEYLEKIHIVRVLVDRSSDHPASLWWDEIMKGMLTLNLRHMQALCILSILAKNILPCLNVKLFSNQNHTLSPLSSSKITIDSLWNSGKQQQFQLEKGYLHMLSLLLFIVLAIYVQT